MNDNELDRLLDLWEAPPPRPSLRHGLSARFPQAERLGFVRPLRWALASVLATVVLAIALAGALAVAQSSDGLSESPVAHILHHLYVISFQLRSLFGAFTDAERAKIIANKIADSDPKVFVDGRLAAPLEFGPAATMIVKIPGNGVYSITSYPVAEPTADGGPSGWVETGRIVGNVIQFRAGGKQVLIECNKPIVDRDHPLFVMHHQ
jgi:hypothetical protein